MHPMRRRRIQKTNRWTKDIDAIAGYFHECIILFNLKETGMTSFKDILTVINHEYLHHIIWRVESEKACSKLDNITDYFLGMDSNGL